MGNLCATRAITPSGRDRFPVLRGSTYGREWRAAVEQLGVLVFQFPKVELTDVRGLSLLRFPLPVVGVSSKEQPDKFAGALPALLDFAEKKPPPCCRNATGSKGGDWQQEVHAKRITGTIALS